MTDRELLEKLATDVNAMKMDMAVHTETHLAQLRQCTMHRSMLDRHDHALFGNGKPGLQTEIAVIKWALGLVGVVSTGLVVHAIIMLFG